MSPNGFDPDEPPAAKALAEIAATVVRRAFRAHQAGPVRTGRAADEVARRLGDVRPRLPSARDLERTVRRLSQAWDESGSLAGVELRHMRRAPWAFFFPKERPGEWLAGNDDLVADWLRWAEGHRRPRVAVALLLAFLDAYPAELRVFDVMRAALLRLLAAGPSPRLRAWRERCERYGFLESDGPDSFVARWFETDVGFDAYLEGAGLPPGVADSAFVRRATRCLLDRARQALTGGRWGARDLEHAFAWLEAAGQLRFRDMTVEVASAFLAPFVGEAPPAYVKDAIQAFLCRVIGDPRLRPQRWQGVPDEIRAVLVRWLVGASLEDFFRVLDETALDRHWRYRKAFWRAYLEKGLIDDAWVVLRRKASDMVRRSFRSDPAELVGGGDSSQSVLLMTIGGLTIAEWSHNGSCRIWKRGSPAAPSLYQRRYTWADLMGRCDFLQRHTGADRGVWQERVASWIEAETGRSVSRAAYMPQPRWNR